MELSTLYRIFTECSGITTDSRRCLQGSLFIALKGEFFNGNTFARQALQDGCAYAVIDEADYAVKGDNRFIVVPDALETLQQLALHHRRQLGTPVIGITGTNGKTTTKELIAAVLSQTYRVLYTSGNLNNHIGVPLTLLRLTAEHEIAVIEMGANHLGEIKALTHIAEPDYGIITNVGKAHLEGFGSFDGVLRTKTELYDYLREKGTGKIFICHDHSYLLNPASGLDQLSYGTNENLFVNGRVTGNSPYLAFEWKEGKSGEPHHIQTRLVGEYNFFNMLAAAAVGRYFKIEPEKIDKALSDYAPQNNRSQLQKTADNTLIIDAYNANPTSMRAAIENFRNMKVEHKVLILGDMKELGPDSAVEHQEIIDYINTCNFEQVILVGELFAATNRSDNYNSYPNVQELIAFLQACKPQGKFILIKGSNSIKLHQTVEFL